MPTPTPREIKLVKAMYNAWIRSRRQRRPNWRPASHEPLARTEVAALEPVVHDRANDIHACTAN